jgi:hypothetical protein
MTKPNSDSSGFGAVELILIVFLVAIIVAVAWFIHVKNTNTFKNESSNDAANISATGPDPTAGWLSRCVSSAGLCIKYPSTWSISLPSNTGFNVDSPDNTAFIQINEQGTVPGYTEKFYTTYQSYLYSGDKSFKVLGGYAEGTGSNPVTAPTYAVVLAGFGDPHPLKIGTSATLLDTHYFIYIHDSAGVSAYARLLPLDVSTNATAKQSIDWLNSASTQTGVKILKSLTTSN